MTASCGLSNSGPKSATHTILLRNLVYFLMLVMPHAFWFLPLSLDSSTPSFAQHKYVLSWHGDAFYTTGTLWGQSTSHLWIPLRKGQWCGTLIISDKLLNSQVARNWRCLNEQAVCSQARPETVHQSIPFIDSAAPSLLTSISVSSWPCPSLNFGLPCIHTPLVSVNGGSKGYLDVSL